jgi:hypothetical protein
MTFGTGLLSAYVTPEEKLCAYILFILSRAYSQIRLCPTGAISLPELRVGIIISVKA